MTTITSIFFQIRALFSYFWKRAGKTSPLPPSSYAPAPMHMPKNLENAPAQALTTYYISRDNSLRAHSRVCDIYESRLKIMKIAFNFILKALFVFTRYFYFCPEFLVIQVNDLKRKIELISTFMTSQTGKHIIAMHILPGIWKSKGNQAGIQLEYKNNSKIQAEWLVLFISFVF